MNKIFKTNHQMNLEMFFDILIQASGYREHISAIFPEDRRNVSSSEGLKGLAHWVKDNGNHPQVLKLLEPLRCARDSGNESVMVVSDDAIVKFHFYDESESYEHFCERLFETLRRDMNVFMGKEVI